MKKTVFIIIILTIFLSTAASFSIPAFARQYKISCTTCHTPFPKLKPYGDEFAGNGMILAEEINERDFISAGDDMLWLNKNYPVAVRLDAFAVCEDKPSKAGDLQTPWGLKLLSGGPIYKNIGYYFYFYMSESGEVAGIEDAYVHFNNVAGLPLDILVGQFQTCDPLMKRELRLTYEDYYIYKIKPGLSGATLTYDRGLLLNYAVEKTGTDIVAMVVNGNGKGEAEGGRYDYDKYKNAGLRLKQDVGQYFSLGGFYYYGKEKLTNTNDITYYGPDFSASIGPVDVTCQYLKRLDSNPSGLVKPPEKDIETIGTVVELVYSPQLDRSRWFLIALYNKCRSDPFISPDAGNLKQQLEYESATMAGTWLLTRNMRFTAEYTRDLFNDGNRLLFGMVTAF